MTAAINARTATTLDFDPDPRGRSMFVRLSRIGGLTIAGRDARRTVDPTTRFTGTMRGRLPMTGVARLGSGRPVVDANAELPDERTGSVINDPALRIFAERLARRQG